MKSQGFTLVELSISIVIIGLLVGGIMTGRNLIHAAELQGAVSEYQKYSTAANNFVVRYDALPGDFRKAGFIWGYADTSGADGGCGDPDNDTGSGTETCDGNGDGQIGTSLENHEQHRFWQHLVNAELIEGKYTGVQGSAAEAHVVIGENAPESKFSGAGWGVDHRGDFGSAWWFQAYYNNAFFLGGQHHVGIPIERIFTPAEAWHIDSKTDDGMPNQGNTTAVFWDDCTDATVNTQIDAEYLLELDTPECSLVFNNFIR